MIKRKCQLSFRNSLFHEGVKFAHGGAQIVHGRAGRLNDQIGQIRDLLAQDDKIVGVLHGGPHRCYVSLLALSGLLQRRMAQQATDAQRRAIADVVITNDGTAEELSGQIDALWGRLQELAQAQTPTGG